jgi:hypothetical protein
MLGGDCKKSEFSGRVKEELVGLTKLEEERWS